MPSIMSSNSDVDDDDENDHFYDAVAGELVPAADAVVVPPMADPESTSPSLDLRPCPPSQDQHSSSRLHRSATSRPSAVSSSSAQSSFAASHRHGSHEQIPQVPPIPSRFLDSGRPATVVAPPATRIASDQLSPPSRRPASSPQYTLAAKAVGNQNLRKTEGDDDRSAVGDNLHRERSPGPRLLHRTNSHGSLKPRTTTVTTAAASSPPSAPSPTSSPVIPFPGESRSPIPSARRESLPAYAHQPTLALLEVPRSPEYSKKPAMSRQDAVSENDPFIELAQGQLGEHYGHTDRSDRVTSRLSNPVKRRSLPAGSALAAALDRGLRSSAGNAYRRASLRVDAVSNDLENYPVRNRTPPSALSHDDDTISVSGRSTLGRPNRGSTVLDRMTIAPSRLTERLRSPQYAERRQSFGSTVSKSQPNSKPAFPNNKAQEILNGSPVESSDPKQSPQDSASGDSQTADTVWDELDDLKSRIKKLELTGKLPPTSSAAVSTEQTERPRTATTAPTTIDSSPKRDRNPEPRAVTSPNNEDVPSTPNVSDLHPLLHSALAKAKPLLNPSLYRSLEASATDALSMAALAGGSGGQGNSFVSGATASDRILRRKADMMCRNLTDLCLALCDGKHEASHSNQSPSTFNTPPYGSMPTIRYSRSNISNDGGPSRPLSRLEARRSSILGTYASNSGFGLSPRLGGDDASGSERETTPSQHQDIRRLSRASSRLRPAHLHSDDVSGDEDPTLRPLSRAMTNISSLHGTSDRPRDHSSGAPRLREAIINRRANNNNALSDDIRPSSRVASMPAESNRRRYLDHYVTPVVEEEDNERDHLRSLTQPKRRMTSSASTRGPSRHHPADGPGRASSLSQRRHALVE
nr:hypothetical protein CFP56_11619 [Quercus suber]